MDQTWNYKLQCLCYREEKMKLLLVSFEYPPYPLAGTGLYALNLVKNLKNHDVTLITPYFGNGERNEQNGKLKIKRIDVKGFNFLPSKVNKSFVDKKHLFGLSLRKYFKKINLNEFELLHCINAWESDLFDFKHLNKYIDTIISVNEHHIMSSSWNPFKFHSKSTDFILRYLHHNILKYFNKKSLEKCTRIISNSYFVKNEIIKYYGINSDKISVVHRGIDTKKFEIKIDKNKYVNHKVLFVGPNMERKGGIYVIQALALVLKEFPDATLTMIGSCSFIYKNLMVRTLNKNNIQDKVKFIDHIQQDQLIPFYKEANVFVMPSLMEALGQVYMEAMMCMTPVIGADVGGVSEIINKDVGYLVEPKDYIKISENIIDIFRNPKKSAEMGKKGRERIKKFFNIDKMIKETLDVYKKVKK